MANKRIDTMEIKQIIKLKHKGKSNRQIADLLQVNRNTVNEYVSKFQRTGLTYGELGNKSLKEIEDLINVVTVKKPGERYKILQGYLPYVQGQMGHIGSTLLVLWQEYRLSYPDGYGYTQFKKYYHQRYGSKTKISSPQPHSLGEQLYADFTGKKLAYTDAKTGQESKAEVFLTVLGYSGYIFCEATQDQKKASVFGALVRSLEYYGGVPQAIIPDNMKTMVNTAHRYEPVLNKTSRQFALHYNTVILPTRPDKAQDKAMVERAVQIIYQHIHFELRHMQFFSLKSLNQQIRKQLKIINAKPYHGNPEGRWSLFDQVEKKDLQDLPIHAFIIKHYKKAKVQKIAHVWLGEDEHFYSVPYQHIGRKVELQYSDTTLEVYYKNERIAIHSRCKQRYGYSTVPEHMSSTHRFVSEWNTEKFISWAEKIGSHTAEFIKGMIHQRPYPEQGYKAAVGVLRLARVYSNERLEKACELASMYEYNSYHRVANILKKKIDMDSDFKENPLPTLPQHDNIRGTSYYQ